MVWAELEEGKGGVLNENSPHRLLGTGNIRRCGLVGESVSPTGPVSLSLPDVFKFRGRSFI